VILNCPSHRHGSIPAREDSPLRGFLGVRPDQRVLLYQGGLSPFRNLDVLVESMARLPDDRIVLAMMGKDNSMGQQLREKAQALGILGTRVMFVPEQPASALLPWTVGADAGIIPYPHIDINTWFMSPNKLFEFMSVGLPILAPHGPEVRRFVGDQGIGMNFHLATHDDFARAITTFFAGPLDAWRVRAAEVAHQYTWETEGLKWFPILAAARAARDARLAEAA
jgi:glycosyltransferase involved in cell wall biosynthesis